MSYEEERVVKLSFDNESFKKGVADTIVALQKLEKQLDIDPKTASRSFDNLTQSVNLTEKSLGNLDAAADKVRIGFSALEVAGITVFANLTTAAIQFGRTLYTKTIGQIQSGGFARALNLENAKFQIEGLGKSWTELKDDILYGVKDTAYGLDEAAKVASQLSSSGMEAGDEMKKTLRGISGVAAMTNSSFSDIGDIFATVAANGKLMTYQLRQFSARGLNVAGNMAKYFKEAGNTALDTEEKVRDAISKGTISFKQFAFAMDDLFGEHAKEANKTFTGAMSNMRAALSRLGEAFQSPMLDFKRRVAVSVIPAIDMITNVLSKFAVPAFTDILNTIASWAEKLSESQDFMKFIYNIAAGIYSWIHNIVRALFDMGLALPDIDGFAKSLANMTEWMVLNGERAEKFRNVIQMLARGFQTLLLIIDAIVYVLEPIYKPILSFLGSVSSSLGDTAKESQSIFDKIQNVIKVIAILLRMGLEKIIPSIINGIKIAVNVLKLLGIALGALVYIIFTVHKAFFNFVKNLAAYIKNAVKNCEWLQKAIVAVYETIRFIIKNIGKGFIGLASTMTTTMGFLWDKVSWLFSDRTVKVNVVADTSNAVKAYGDYSSAAQEAQKSGEKASNSKFTIKKGGGGIVQGAFGGDSGDFWVKVKEGMGEVDDETKNVDKSMTKLADGFSSGFGAIDQELDKSKVFGEDNVFASRFTDRMNSVLMATQGFASVSPLFASIINVILGSAVVFASTLEIVFDGIDTVLRTATKSLPEIAEGLTDSLISVFKRLNAALPDLLKEFGIALDSFNFWDVLKAIVLVNLLVGALFKLSIATRIADPSFFNSIATTILAFGAVLATIGVIAKFVDNKSLKIVFIGTGVIAAILAIFMGFLTILTAIKKFSNSASKLLTGLTTAIKNLKLINVNVNKRMLEFGEVLKDLAILVGVIFGFAVGIMIYLDRFGTEKSFSNLMKAGILMGTMIYAIIGLIAIVVGVLGNKSGTKSLSEFTWKLKGGINFKNDLNTSLIGLTTMISAISIFIGVLSSSVFALSFRNIDDLKKIFGLIIGSFVSMILVISGLVVYLTESLLKKGNFWTRDENADKKLGQIMKSISTFILAIGKMMAGFVVAAKVLQDVSVKKLSQITKSFAIIFGGIIVLMWSYFAMIKLMSGIKIEDKSPTILKLTIMLSGFMTVVSLLMVVIAKAVAILGGSNPNTLNQSALIIGGMLLGIAVMFIAILKIADHLNSVRTDKAASLTITLSNMAGVLGILTGAIASIVLITIVLAKTIDSLTDVSSIIWSIGIIGGIFIAFAGFYAIINKTANLMPSVQTVYGLAILSGAMTVMILGIAVFMKIISTINIDGKLIAVTIGSILIALVSMVALSKFISGGALTAIAAGWKGLLVIAGFIAAIAGIIALIGRAIGFVGENISILANSFKEIANVPWDTLQNTTTAMKKCIADVIDAMIYTLNFKNAVGIIVLSMSLKMLADSVQGLAKLKPEQLTAFAVTISMILSTFADNWQGALVALAFTALFSAIGWSLAIGMLGFIVFAALVPVMVIAVNNAIKALNNLGELTIDVEKYMTAIETLMPLAAELFAFGLLLGIGGTGLAIGAITLLAAVFILGKAYGIMEADMSSLEKALEYLGASNLLTFAVRALVDGILLSTGAGMLAIGAILMIAAVGIMKGVYKIMSSDITKIKMAIAYLGRVAALSVLAIATGIVLTLGSATLAVGAILFLVAAGALALSLFALQKAFEYVDFGLLSIGLEELTDVCEKLGTVGVVLSESIKPFVIGAMLLALGMAGFMIAGIELLIGATTFGLGIAALAKAFEAVDVTVITKNIKEVVIFVALLAGIGLIMSIALIPFTLAAALFSLAAGMIGVGITLFTTSLLIGSAALYGAIKILEPTFEKMFEVFETVGFLDILGIVGKLSLLGLGVLIAGTLLSLGGIPFVIGTALLLAGAAILSVAMDKFNSALEIRKIAKSLIGLGLLVAGLLIFALLSPILIMAGLSFIVFAASLLAGAAIISTIASVISDTLESFEDIYDDFYDAADNIIDGLVDGIEDGAEWVIETIEDLAEDILDSFCEILGIHSPAEEFIKAAANCIAGIAEGLGMDHDKVYDKIYDTGMGMLDTFAGFKDGMREIGEDIGLIGGDSLIGKLFESIFEGDFNINDLLDMTGSTWMSGLSNIFSAGNDAMIKQLEKQKFALQKRREEIERQEVPEYLNQEKEKELAKILYETNSLNAEIDQLRKQSSFFDFDIPSADEYMKGISTGGSSDLTSPETTAALSEAGQNTGSGSNNLAKSTGSNVGNTVNNNYNFIQNNYSPEPIDRTELYVQTQNQLDSWYKYVRDYT